VAENTSITDRVREILRPYAAKWSGVRSRGDIVIPEREIAEVVDQIVGAMDSTVVRQEASDAELFDVLMKTRGSESVQSQMEALRSCFTILRR
jgi:hypothetical protein